MGKEHAKTDQQKANAVFLMSEKNKTKHHHRNKEGPFIMKTVQFTRKIEQFQICMQIVLKYKKLKEENNTEK